MKSKKEKPLYDENGHWVEERGRIKGAIRRTFRLSPQMKEVLQEARVELPPALKKDGTPGKKNQIRYRCAMCQQLFSQKHVQVDHIEPVVPLCIKEEAMSYDKIVRGVFCKKDNLQVLCSTPQKLLEKGKKSCHRLKTDEENFVRSCWDKWFDENFLPNTLDEIHLMNEKFKGQFKDYLKNKEEERLAKEKRKLEREAKRRKNGKRQ